MTSQNVSSADNFQSTNRETVMVALSAIDLAIRIAKEAGTLRVIEREGRFGPFWAISDDHGTICVALSEQEASDIVAGSHKSATRLVA